ncbi:MAG: glycosyltransferase [Thermodesulfobacteriota bacterium]
MLEFIFWFFSILIVYIYFGYPLLLRVLTYPKMRRWRSSEEFTPTVTLVIAAHNEECVIKEKLDAVLAEPYPKGKLQIVVASDASTDRTNEIVRGYSKKGVELYDQIEHKGKSAALNYIVEKLARGEVVVFNDATTELEAGALKKICSYFSDIKIGAVAARLVFKKTRGSQVSENHGLYWRYEESIRKLESDFGVMPFVSGAFYAIRRELYTNVPPDMPDDSVSPLGVYRQRSRVVYALDAVAAEVASSEASSEFRIKTRGIIRELTSIFHFKELLNPLDHPAVSLVLFSHRLLRWSVPIFLIIIMLVNLYLYGPLFYKFTFWVQFLFYLLALWGLVSKSSGRVVGLASYFSLVNTAALVAIIRFLAGERRATWKPER